ncbi:uncharacterized protein [Gossypium hirsutum]|uniref:Uncharacterized protein n=1 Tax=Gossypium hirsutum TaxID=3635 RepID=A0ABM2ZLT4_GOSHI|nr:uncharacterized protein LOC107905310 [Gossypium hirsutum]
MGFKKVYKCLMDIFPQKCNKHAVQVYFLTPTAHVDSRILKAVAIVNSKDVDAAAEIVLFEILPYLSKRIVAGSSSSWNRSPPMQANEGLTGIILWKERIVLAIRSLQNMLVHVLLSPGQRG